MNTIKRAGLVAIPLLTTTVLAQPVRHVAGGVMVNVPVRVIYEHPDSCRFTVEVAEVGPIPVAQIKEALPKACPVFTRLPSGELLQGFSIVNWKGVETESLPYCFPGYIIVDQNKQYKVASTLNAMYAASCSTPRMNPAPSFDAKYSFQMHIFDRLPIRRQPSSTKQAEFSVIMEFPEGQPTQPGVPVAELKAALQHVFGGYARLLERVFSTRGWRSLPPVFGGLR